MMLELGGHSLSLDRIATRQDHNCAPDHVIGQVGKETDTALIHCQGESTANWFFLSSTSGKWTRVLAGDGRYIVVIVARHSHL